MNEGIKIAIVHDWLNQKAGGAEQVLDELAQIYPSAPIYTMIYNADNFNYPRQRIHTSFLQYAPRFLKERSRYLLPLIPLAIRLWSFRKYDIVISSSCAFIKNIYPPKSVLHICYCHSPMRFAWDYWPQYLDEQNIGLLQRTAVRAMVWCLRKWDLRGVKRVDAFIANSETVRGRISKYYQRDSVVINPPTKSKLIQATKKADYYVTLGMLTPYKKIDLAIEAFNHSGRKLKVIGDGPDRARLEALAKDNIEFCGFVEEAERDRLLSSAKGLIFPNIEDFGIAPIDAMAAGTPVIAYKKGGATETVIDKQTGIFFNEQTPEAINQAVEEAGAIDWSIDKLHTRAGEFSTTSFRQAIKELVNQEYGEV